MHAYLITGGTPELRLEEIQKRLKTVSVSPFDITYLTLDKEEEHIGIDAMRAFKKRLLLAPQQSSVVVGIIQDAHMLTTEAQNSVLKLLEEPPPHAMILLETTSADLLLPTVTSRCQINLLRTPTGGDAAIQNMQAALMSLLSSSIGKKISLIDQLAKDRTLAKKWTQDALVAARAQMLVNCKKVPNTVETKKITTLIRALITAQKELAVNVNPKLVLDTVFLSI